MRKIAINLETEKRNASRSLPVNQDQSYRSVKIAPLSSRVRCVSALKQNI